MTNERQLDDLVAAINEANPALDAEDRKLALGLYELLSMGAPVEDGEIAERAALGEAFVRQRLDEWSGVFRDGDGRVIGFWGLALQAMPHQLDIDGRTLYTWCAFDPLFIVPLLGKTGRVSSTCPVTGSTIALTVDAEGVSNLDPPQAVLSFLEPEDGLGDDIIERFCHYIHLFASPQAADAWVAEHPGTFVLSIEDGFEIGRRTLGRLSGSKAKR